jgi:hypothetical protein
MSKLDLIKVASKYLEYLDSQGLEVEAVQDFEAVPTLVQSTGRHYQLPAFDIRRVDHTRRSTFWLFAKRGDVTIGGAAAMLQDLGDEDAGLFLQRIATGQYPNPNGPAISRIAPPIGQKMSGRIAYIGELSFADNSRGSRQTLSAFMRLLQVLDLLEWDVDWTYAFIPDRHVNAQLHKVYGFTQILPNAQTWNVPVPEKRSSEEWWVGAPRSELIWLFNCALGRSDIL